jgi:hypothetical protein
MPERPDLAKVTASLTLVHETEFARVQVGRPTRLLVLEWFAYANAEQYRQMLEDALRIGQELGCERWIGHNQRLKVIAPASQRFTAEEWWPRFATLPLKRLAIVVTEDDFGRISLERIIERATPLSPFDIRYFPTFDESLVWVHDDATDAAAPVRLGPGAPAAAPPIAARRAADRSGTGDGR